jgi:molybdenum-dependent DNA-binding transcriptional regulator ModE
MPEDEYISYKSTWSASIRTMESAINERLLERVQSPNVGDFET